MARKILTNKESGLSHRDKVNSNFEELYDISGGGVEDYWYGFDMTVGQTDSNVTKIKGDGVPTGAHPVSDKFFPAIVNEDASINYELNPNNISQKKDGSAADLSGVDGDVVRVNPAYYFKFELESNTLRYKESPYALPGYTYVPKHYFGIFPGDEDTAGKLRSRSGVTALTNKIRSYYRGIAAAKGQGWCITPYFFYMADYFTAVSYFGSLNSQDFIGEGATNAVSADWSTYNGYYPVWKTDGGSASSHGSGAVTATPSNPNTSSIINGQIPLTVSSWGDGTQTLNTNMAIMWWLRDVFGPTWYFYDGININYTATDAQVYISKNPVDFADDTTTNYEKLADIAVNTGYISELVPGTILPTLGGVSGGSTTHCGDRHYSPGLNSGWRVARFGGDLNDGSRAGLLYSSFINDSGYGFPSVGARLCWVDI